MVSPLTVRGAPLRLAPEIFAAELASWVNFGRPPKDALLLAILKNDLTLTVALAGSNWPLIRGTLTWLYNFAPVHCFGSREAYEMAHERRQDRHDA